MGVVTSTSFISNVMQLCSLPASQTRVNTSAFYYFSNRKMKDTIVPVIHSLNQEYFVWKTTTAIVANQTQYELPSRAFGRKLRELKLVNTAGGTSNLPQVSIERTQFYRTGSLPAAFYMYGDVIEIVPTPTATGYSLQLWWFLAPGDIVTPSEAAVVVSVTDDDVTVSSVPSQITNGAVVDFIQASGAARYLEINKTITGIAGNVISFAADTVPDGLAAGDYISLAGKSPVIQLPEVAICYLETLTAMEILGAISDYEGQGRLKETRDEQKTNMLNALAPRIDGEVIPLVNDYGFLGGPRRGIWNAWGGV